MGYTPSQLAARINLLSTDVTSPDAYSIIVVHVWTMTVDDVIQTVSLFDDDVVVRLPSDFVADLTAQVVV